MVLTFIRWESPFLNHRCSPFTRLWSVPFPGLLQFLSSAPGDGPIAPALEPAHATVKEEDGDIRLVVARAQGLLGRVMVGYRTTPFTASSPEDYEVDKSDVDDPLIRRVTDVMAVAGLPGNTGLPSRREAKVHYCDRCRQSCP